MRARHGYPLSFRLESEGILTTTNTTQLEAALLNLVMNARDALAGRGEIEVLTRAVQIVGDAELEDRRYVELCVRDDGPGMPPEIATHAFEAFFTTKPEGKGTDLGLSQVFGVAIKAGGIARVRSAAGSGTEVSLFLKGQCPTRKQPLRKARRKRRARTPERAACCWWTTKPPCAMCCVRCSGTRNTKWIRRTAAWSSPIRPCTALAACCSRVLGETHPRLPVIMMTGYDDLDRVRAQLPTMHRCCASRFCWPI